MKRWLMDLLACPAPDCRSSLNLEVFTSHPVESNDEQVEEIDEALITCPKCKRWYPVIDGIACMLPDSQRLDGKQHREESAFLERWKERISPDILEEGIPFGLNVGK
ncbi:MAG: Trm112 family protein [Candidatus Thorarchaeota archaeon]